MTYHPYRPTEHAEQRRAEMGLGTKEVKRTINQPDMEYPGGRKHPGNRRCFQRGRLVVIMDTDTGETVTMLWHLAECREDGPA
jgi:hypothetical protein